MRWRSTRDDWKRRFAFLPLEINGQWHWLEPYWARFEGLYTAVHFGPTPPPEATWATGRTGSEAYTAEGKDALDDLNPNLPSEAEGRE